MDHFARYQLSKIRQPERGFALGTTQLSDLVYMKGVPSDWVIKGLVPRQLLETAPLKDKSDYPRRRDECSF